METEFRYHKTHKIKICDKMFSVNSGPWIQLSSTIDETQFKSICNMIDDIERQVQFNIRQSLGLDYF